MASGLLNYTYFLKLLKISELPLHLVSFHSSSILLPLGLQPVISPASILHSPFLSSPSSSGPRGCHRHVLKLTSAVVSLLFTHLPSFPKLPEQNPDPQHGVMIIQDLVPPTFQLILATLLGLIWLAASSSTLHWVLPALHICSCYRLCQFFLPFSPTPPVLSCNCAHSLRFCSTPPWSHLWSLQGEMSPPFSSPLHTDYASLTGYNYVSLTTPLLFSSYVYLFSHHVCTYWSIHPWKEGSYLCSIYTALKTADSKTCSKDRSYYCVTYKMINGRRKVLEELRMWGSSRGSGSGVRTFWGKFCAYSFFHCWLR